LRQFANRAFRIVGYSLTVDIQLTERWQLRTSGDDCPLVKDRLDDQLAIDRQRQCPAEVNIAHDGVRRLALIENK
jgi:hypothetical protein